MGDEYPLVPRQLPDGTMVMEERGKAAAVWQAIKAYDPRTSLVRNFAEQQWEIWRQNEDGQPGRIGIWKQEYLPEPNQVLEHLQSHDTRKGYDPIAVAERAHLDRLVAEDKAAEAIGEQSADRIQYEMKDEFPAHMPASRPMPLGSNGR